MKPKNLLYGFLLATFVSMLVPESLLAIPSFSRKYGTGCSTCHYAYPRLNPFGRAFANNGYRMPGGDDAYIKDEPVMLGSSANKQVFPNAIWPSDIPGSSVASFRLIGRTHLTSRGTPRFQFENPHEFELLMGGTLGETFSFIGEVELEGADELGYNFILQYSPRSFLNIKIGNVDPMPIRESQRLTREHYNYGDFRIRSGGWRLRDDAAGIEFWGAANGRGGRGGWQYALGVVNGMGGATDIDNNKDVYGRLDYKFGGLGKLGGISADQAIESPQFWREKSVTLGIFSYRGRQPSSTGRDDFYLVGPTVDVFYKDMNLFGTYLRQKDDNPKGNRIPVRTDTGFAELDWVAKPWLIPFVRYEMTNIDLQRNVRTTVPGLVVMMRANIRMAFDARIRSIRRTVGTDRYTFQLDWAF